MLVCKQVHFCSVDLYDYVAGEKREEIIKGVIGKYLFVYRVQIFLRSGVMFQSIFFEEGILGNGITCK